MEFFPLNSWAKEPLSSYEEFSSEDEDEDTHTENELPVKLTPIPRFLKSGIKTNENPPPQKKKLQRANFKRWSDYYLGLKLPSQEGFRSRKGEEIAREKFHRDTKNHWLWASLQQYPSYWVLWIKQGVKVFSTNFFWWRNLLTAFEKATQNVTKNKNAKRSGGDFTVHCES